MIDKGIHLGHLKWTLETFLKAFFERDDVVLRLRPSYFPFTEPSVEVDVGYSVVKGKRVIGGSEGWMEVLGSGMVHRKVIEACGLDPDVWQGFAFGTGVDRLAMLKYGMDDLRAFFDGDNRWLQHYGFNALDVPTLRRRSWRMKFSLSWLKAHLETDATIEQVADCLNAIGLEVEGIENPAEALRAFRIAKIVKAIASSAGRKAASAGRRRRRWTSAGRVRRSQCAGWHDWYFWTSRRGRAVERHGIKSHRHSR